MSEIRLVDRDYKIIQEIDRWRVVQGKHIKELTGFDGQKACDRRLRKLIEAGYIKRQKILYGVAGIYSNTNKAKNIAAIANTDQKIRVEQILHDIAVLDTAIYISKKYGIEFSDMITEMELHRKDGFGVRKHRPDFVYTIDGKTTCVEIELTLKAKTRLEKNIQDNFMNYDNQLWIVPSLNSAISDVIRRNIPKYPCISILELKEVQGIYEEI